MSRFPEVQRVERAIRTKEAHQLRWALDYLESRLKLDHGPELQQQWTALLERVRQAMAAGPR
ncbi:MAG: hypothetical protein AB7O97_22735 [Planctomycetota bacterium]